MGYRQWSLKEADRSERLSSAPELLYTFFMVQLSHPYTTTGKTIALTRWAFVGIVMSLPNSPSRASVHCCVIFYESLLFTPLFHSCLLWGI